MNEHKVIAIKAAGDEWMLDVLGVPFGDAANRDGDGEWFDAGTKLHLDKFGLPAIAYYHGADDDGQPAASPEYIGKAVSSEQKPDGVWFRVVLDKANALAKRVWDAAQQGLARASSGTIGHLMRKDEDGRILEWPVAELSLLELGGGKRPANNYAVAVPVLKALGIDAVPEQETLSTAATVADDIHEPSNADGEIAEPEAGRTPAAAIPEAGDGSNDDGAAKALLLNIELLELEVTP